MRHRKSGKQLGRPTAHRHAMIRNLAVSLVEHGRIETTLERAKALRVFVEPLITLGKKGDVSARRLAMTKLPNKGIVHKIFDELAPNYTTRPGGYTRIIRTGVRRGDMAKTAIIEFVEKAAPAKKTTTKKAAETAEEKPAAKKAAPKKAAPKKASAKKADADASEAKAEETKKDEKETGNEAE